MAIKLALVAVLALVLLLKQAASLTSLETQEDYLNHLYEQVKDRPLRDGELNLLPDNDGPGFANTVRCVLESKKGTSSDLSRKMQFQRPTIKSSEPLIDVKLVINLPPDFTQNGEVTLYESSIDNPEARVLDRASTPSCSTTCWFQLTIGLENIRDSMEFLVRFNHRDGDFVEDLNPMIILYTYRDQSEAMSNMFAEANRHSQSRRQAGADANVPTTPTPPPSVTLSELKTRNSACRKETAYLTYSQLRWLDEDISLIAPSYISFDFCFGHCDLRFNLNPQDIPAELRIRRTRVLQAINQLGGGMVLPKPACVPSTYTAKEIIYSSGDLVTMTTLPSVHSCSCRL